MREIKFEVFDNFNKYICIPFLFEKSTESDRISEDDRFNAPYIYYATANDYIDGIRRPCFIREFTGLQDVSGKDIYEGDILDIYGDLFIVIFEQKECGFGITNRNGKQSLSYRITENSTVKVIGNIYENPELLEQGRGKNNE